MNNLRISRQPLLPVATAMLLAIFAFGSYSVTAATAGIRLSLNCAQESPANPSMATGIGDITVGSDKTVSGSITTTGLAGTMAHIHIGAIGANGPVAITLVKNGDTYSVPAGTKFTDAQYDSFQKGGLYINVHSAANPNGEIRGQLKPL